MGGSKKQRLDRLGLALSKTRSRRPLPRRPQGADATGRPAPAAAGKMPTPPGHGMPTRTAVGMAPGRHGDRTLQNGLRGAGRYHVGRRGPTLQRRPTGASAATLGRALSAYFFTIVSASAGQTVTHSRQPGHFSASISGRRLVLLSLIAWCPPSRQAM
jgi:hypothetical protein